MYMSVCVYACVSIGVYVSSVYVNMCVSMRLRFMCIDIFLALGE